MLQSTTQLLRRPYAYIVRLQPYGLVLARTPLQHPREFRLQLSLGVNFPDCVLSAAESPLIPEVHKLGMPGLSHEFGLLGVPVHVDVAHYVFLDELQVVPMRVDARVRHSETLVLTWWTKEY